MNTQKQRPSLHAVKLVSALAALASASSAFAADVYWNNSSLNWNTSTATWNTASDNSGTTGVWVNGDSAVFMTSTVAATNTAYSLTNGGVTVDNITQTFNRVRITGGTLTLADTSAIYDAQTRATGAGSGDYDLRIDSIIANSSGGASSVTKNGAGILMLTGANTFSGGFTLNAGSVFVETQASAFGTGTLTLAGGNLVKSFNTTAVTFANAVNVTGAANLAVVNNGNNGDLKFSGAFTGTGTLSVANANVAGFSLRTASIKILGDISNYQGKFSIETIATANNQNRLRFGPEATGNYGTIDGAKARFATSGATTDVGQQSVIDVADGAYGTFKLGELSGTGGIIRAGFNSTAGNTIFQVGALNTSTIFAGRINNNGTGKAELDKVGTGALDLSLAGGNSYGGGTTVSAGRLLVSNTSGSGTGVGAVTVQAAGTLGGAGIIAPTGANGVLVNGALAPGGAVSATTGGAFADGVGTLTFNLGGTTGGVTLASGAGLKFELGAAGVSLAAAGASDLIALTSASAGDFVFNGNTVDFLGTGAEGYYKLFDTSLDDTTWSGLTFDGTSGVVSFGLSYANLSSGLLGAFVVGTASNGGDLGDIYFNAFTAIPEPGSYAAILGLATLGAVALRRRRR